MRPRHYRSLIGLVLMLLAVFAYVGVLLHIGAPPEPCAPTWMQLLRQYAFPGAMFIGGYNLFQKGALAEIATAWRGRKP